ncbi:hypothetical protein D3C80_1278570 [compost metagenome]
MTGHPANIGSAPEHLALAVIEHGLEGQRRLQQVTRGGVQHALGFASAAGGVEDEQRVFGIHRLGWALVTYRFDCFVVPDIAAFTPVDLATGALDHHHRTDIRATEQGLVDVVLQRHALAAANTLVGGDQCAAIGVENPVAQRIRREAAEHHRVNGADAAAGEHGVGRFRNHGHIDAHPVAFFYPTLLEYIGQAADLLVQFAVGDDTGIGGVVALTNDRRLIAPGGQVTVDAVVADIELRTFEPDGLAGLHVALLDLAPGLDPVQGLGLFGPEGIRVIDGLAVQALIVGLAQLRRFADGIGLGKVADIEHGGVLF